jgi:esterase/lipase superfamily enzyme
MIILSNRKAQRSPDGTPFLDGNLFGETMPSKTSTELFLAEGEWTGSVEFEDYENASNWKTKFHDNGDKNTFQSLLETSDKHILVFIHGFDQPFMRSMMKAAKLEAEFDVQVVLFSWPSHPPVPKTFIGRKALRYVSNKSRRRAKRSAPALIQALKMTSEAFAAVHGNRTLNVLAHSMANLVLKRAFEYDAEYAAKLPFTNVLLHQAEVPAKGHSVWTDKLNSANTFVTINENDFALKALWLVKSARLGSSLNHLESDNITYVDLTQASDVENRHTIVLHSLSNEKIRGFLTNVFHGVWPLQLGEKNGPKKRSIT